MVALLMVVVIATGALTVARRLVRPAPTRLVILLAVLVALRALVGADTRCPPSRPRGSRSRRRAPTRSRWASSSSRGTWRLRTHALDLGYYVQVVWSIAAGRTAPYVTFPPMHALGRSLSRPILYSLVPLTWVAPGAIVAAARARPLVLAARRPRGVRLRGAPARSPGPAARGGARAALSAQPVAPRDQPARHPSAGLRDHRCSSPRRSRSTRAATSGARSRSR